ncbi:Ars2 [Bugula neritina]|uniref:Ars2 n=1 Tax=Bugula neritina TaxID=10212 RepID=A0A7J7JTN7_BUGNE|nr:Ars2 [Bugula neritina]
MLQHTIEKFISSNTQELGKDKWLCPLSGKKFKGPEFVRKHILSKHGEKIEEVKTEARYFNAYLEDSKRPQLPEHPNNTAKSSGGPRRPPPGDMGPPQGPPGYGAPGMGHPPYGSFRGGFRGGFDHFGGGRGGFGPRPDPYNNREAFRRHPGGGAHNRFGSGGRRDGRNLVQYTDLDAPSDDIF